MNIHWFLDRSYILKENKCYELDEVQTYVLDKIIKNKLSFKKLSEIIDNELDINNIEETINILEQVLFDLNKIDNFNDMISKKQITYSGTKGKRYPYSLTISLTSKCYLGCKHCYKDCTSSEVSLSYENLSNFLDSLIGKVNNITFTGGEPFLYDEIDLLINKYSKYFHLYIITGGFFPHDTLSKIDLSTLSSIQFSLYGTNKNDYADFTNTNKFDLIEKNLSYILNSKKNTIIAYQAKTSNITELERLIKFCIGINVKYIKIGSIFEQGRATTFSFNKCDEELIDTNINLLREKYKESVEILFSEDDYVSNTSTVDYFSCYAGKLSYNILENGDILPCDLCHDNSFILSNISKDYSLIFDNDDIYSKFEKVWLGNKFLNSKFKHLCSKIINLDV